MLTEKISNSGYAIHGAQVVAYGAYVALKSLCHRSPECFVVSHPDGHPREIDGIPVRTLDGLSRDILIVVAVTELLQDEIVSELERRGYGNFFRLTAHEEHLLMSAYFDRIGKFPLLGGAVGGEALDLAMFEVKNHRDKPLKTTPPPAHAYRYALQAGAALSEERIASLLDDTGENISAKNRQYCEMSAAYWVWKNTKHAWVGIEHYRRHLLVDPGGLGDGVDAVLPLPYLCYPDTLAQFGRFVSGDVLEALLTALGTLHPNEYAGYLRILHGPYQYTYNLVCARREVFDAYCQWLFTITEYMETLGVPEIAETRALSYVAEVLTNLYFMSNADRLSIRHAEKEVLCCIS